MSLVCTSVFLDSRRIDLQPRHVPERRWVLIVPVPSLDKRAALCGVEPIPNQYAGLSDLLWPPLQREVSLFFLNVNASLKKD